VQQAPRAHKCMKIHTILPDLVLIIPFTLPPCYDIVTGIRGLYRRLSGYGEDLRPMIFLVSPGLSKKAGGGAHWNVTVQFCGSMPPLIGGLLLLSSKSSVQPLRSSPLPPQGVNIISAKRGVRWQIKYLFHTNIRIAMYCR
jgi:hypothetical protein